jgi:hypothetical protein
MKRAQLAILALAVVTVVLVLHATLQTGSGTSTAPRSSPSASLPVMDNCLVGTWKLEREVDHFTVGNTQVILTGLAGATLTVTESGAATYNYNGSANERGRSGTQVETVALRGTRESKFNAAGGNLKISPVSNSVTQTATLNSVTQPSRALANPDPGVATYACSTIRLQMTGQNDTRSFSYTAVYARNT